MTTNYHIIGNYISPYVRKVLVCMELKVLDYSIDPIAPFVGNERFSELSPLRRIPVLIDGDRVINDSSVICQYLDELHPQPSLYPADIGDRAQARWIEEYCDTWLGDVVIWGMFFQKGVKRHLFGEEPDETIIARARDEQLPIALDYLESQMPAEGFLFGPTQRSRHKRRQLSPQCRFRALYGRCAALAAYCDAAGTYVGIARLPEAR